MAPIEKRKAQRKVFHSAIKILVEKVGLYEGVTIDISTTGLAATVTGKSFPAGQVCWIRFTILIGSKPHQVEAQCRIIYSICTHNGFKTGFQFLHMNELNAKMIYVFTGG
jgi:hypothetical protein